METSPFLSLKMPKSESALRPALKWPPRALRPASVATWVHERRTGGFESRTASILRAAMFWGASLLPGATGLAWRGGATGVLGDGASSVSRVVTVETSDPTASRTSSRNCLRPSATPSA